MKTWKKTRNLKIQEKRRRRKKNYPNENDVNKLFCVHFTRYGDAFDRVLINVLYSQGKWFGIRVNHGVYACSESQQSAV